MRKILLIGKDGQVGFELQRELSRIGLVMATGRNAVDLMSPDSVADLVRRSRPDIIVNAAAYTAVDRAEEEREAAMMINGVAPGILAEEARRANALLVHYSTDYVFDGAKDGLYTEADAPNPLNCYGRSKLAGEQAIAAAGATHLILRTSWVYGSRGRNFMTTILRLAASLPELRIVDDQFGAPTWSRAIARATRRVLARCCALRPVGPMAALQEVSGVYHFSAGGFTSWCGFASGIVEYGLGGAAGKPRITPIPAAQFAAVALRPRNSMLSTAHLQRTFGMRLPEWDADLLACLRSAGLGPARQAPNHGVPARPIIQGAQA